jgi:Right handed beta helix region/Calx-beta domain
MEMYGPKATSAPAGAIILHPGDNISATVSAAPAGTTFYFEAGVYRGVSLTPKTGQTFIGAAGAILNGSAVLTDWTQSGNLWVIGGQTQQGRVNTSAEFVAGTQRPGNPETVFLDNTPLKPVDALSKVVPGTFYFDYAADQIYIADNPAGHTVEAGKLTDAFHGSATNVTVQNLVIEKYDPMIQDGAIRGDQNWTIRDNEVRLNYAVGITAHDGSQIIGNYVHDNGQMGLGGYGNNILVQGNELATNGFWSGIDPLWEAGGFKFADTDALVVRGNYAHDNKGTGLWTDINNIHTLYEDNVVVHNTINGISHEISYDAIIRNNTLFGNGYGDTRGWGWGSEINIQNSQNVQVYGNRVEMTGGGNGIVLIQQNRGSGTYGTYTTTGNQIHDNTIVDHDGHGSIGGFADYNQSGMLNGGNTWSNNQYFMSDGGDRFEWGSSKTFAQFKTAAQETGSISQSYPDTSGWLTGTTTPGASAVFAISALAADKAEGQSGTTPFTFTVTRTGDASIADSAAWSLTGSGANPASASDFVDGALPSGTVSFAAGETSKMIAVNVSGDTVVESDEGFTVTLSNPSTGAMLGTASAIGTIRSDDAVPSVLSIATASADRAEGRSGTTPFTFTVTQTGDTGSANSVAWSLAGSGANPASASDFVGGALPSGTVAFAAGETSKTIAVNVSGDTAVESDEGFTVTLSNPSTGAMLGTASVIGTILNDDTRHRWSREGRRDYSSVLADSSSTTATNTESLAPSQGNSEATPQSLGSTGDSAALLLTNYMATTFVPTGPESTGSLTDGEAFHEQVLANPAI